MSNFILNIKCDVDLYNEFYKLEDYSNYTKKSDCGFDLFCPDDITIPAKSLSNKIDLKIICSLMSIPESAIYDFYLDKNKYKYVGYKIYPRSSMGSKTPLRLSNSVGIIDPEYRGNIMILLDNHSDQDYKIQRGDRLVQIVSFSGEPIACCYAETLNKTSRGTGGFGSTGR